ncbi:MAG: tyrosine-type recombinase/integrase [Anaerolineae bacterium]|nr:tyrosine-type recombinase/integrase [Anaerolineae bacterium]
MPPSTLIPTHPKVQTVTTTEGMRDSLTPLVEMVTNTVPSPNSKRAYRAALVEFLAWLKDSGYTGLNAAAINAYVEHLRQSGRSKSAINQQLAAIRKLAEQAAVNGLLGQIEAWGIAKIKNEKQRGRVVGHWLEPAQAEHLIREPLRLAQQEEISHLKALRDRAILSVMIGAGLRRSEVAQLSFTHLQQREGRWVFANLVGKGEKPRTFGIPEWVKQAIDAWTGAARLRRGRVFRALNKGLHPRLSGAVKTKLGYITDGNLSDQAIANIVDFYAQQAGIVDNEGAAALTPHDLRRTAASLALKGGATIRQIQAMLGHESITTTEKYLEPMMSLKQGAADFIQIEIEL